MPILFTKLTLLLYLEMNCYTSLRMSVISTGLETVDMEKSAKKTILNSAKNVLTMVQSNPTPKVAIVNVTTYIQLPAEIPSQQESVQERTVDIMST